MAFNIGEDIIKGFAGSRTALKMLANETSAGGEFKYSANAILEKLRGYGYSFNDSKARADIAANRLNLDTAKYWKSVNYNNHLNVYRLPVSDVKLNGPVQYTITVYGKDPLTGEAASRTVKLPYAMPVTKNMAIQEAMDLVNTSMLSSDPEVAKRYPIQAEYGTVDEIYTSLGAF